MLTLNGIRETSRWAATVARVTAATAAAATSSARVIGRQMEVEFAKDGAIPVYKPNTAATTLTEPTSGFLSRKFTPTGLPSGDAWVQTVINSLVRQYSLPVTPPSPGALQGAIGEMSTWTDAHRFMVGMVSRSRLDSATQYDAKIILRTGQRPPQKGTKGYDIPPPEHQLMWWDWEAKEWRTASFLGRPDGSAEPIGINDSARPTVPAAGWRKALPAGTGYWAEVEFGTEGTQVPASLIPGAGEDLVTVYLRNPSEVDGRIPAMSAVAMTRTHKQSGPKKPYISGIRPRLFLMRVAAEIGKTVRDGKGNPGWDAAYADFRTTFRGQMGAKP